MSVTIKEFNFSLVWVDTLVQPLVGSVPSDAPLGDLTREESYKALFKKVLDLQGLRNKNLPLNLLTGTNDSIPFVSPPWPKAEGQHFWHEYLKLQRLDTIGGGKAWNSLVPLRTTLPCTIEAASWSDPFPVSLSFLKECFFYPHGVGFAVSVFANHKPATASDGFSFDDLLKLVPALKKNKFKVEWKGQKGLFSSFDWNSSAEITLDSLAGLALAASRMVVGGSAAAAEPSSAGDPFTILTIVDGEDADPRHVKENVHRFLDRLTGWGTNPYADLPPLETMSIDVKSAGGARVLYARKRGRAVWFPDLFMDEERQHLLRCYHRNLTLASLQVESLSGIAVKTAAILKRLQPVPQPMSDCAIKAGGSLGRLYGHKDYYGSYRSMSLAKQMEQGNNVSDINLLRQKLDIGNGKPLGAGDDPDEAA